MNDRSITIIKADPGYSIVKPELHLGQNFIQYPYVGTYAEPVIAWEITRWKEEGKSRTRVVAIGSKGGRAGEYRAHEYADGTTTSIRQASNTRTADATMET
jgi:hypothetical protein